MARLMRTLFLISLAIAWAGLAWGQFAGGSGTPEDPYQVADAAQLYNLRACPGAWFIQTGDIDLAPWNDGEGWVPCDLAGVYDGGGHRVFNLQINRPGGYFQGLFARVFGQIHDLRVEGGEVVGAEYAGLLAGYQQGGRIFRCSAEGAVSGNSAIGGIVGCNDFAGTLSDCAADANVLSGQGEAGGLAGVNNGEICRCSASGKVNGPVCGGLAGANGGQIANSFNSASVAGCQAAGGIAGHNSGTLSQCYSRGPICGNCAGGLVATGEGSALRCYWDTESSGTCWSGCGEGRTTDCMVFPHPAQTFVDWDWQIWKPDPEFSCNAGYPYLRPPGEIPTQAPAPAWPVFPEPQAQDVSTASSLSWRAGFTPGDTDAPTGYKLWLGTDDPPSNLCAGLDLGLLCSQLPALDFGSIYNWRIVPYNSVGEASDCPVWNFGTRSLASVTPAVPANVSVSVDQGVLRLVWDPVTASLAGNPLNPDCYLVLAGDDPSAPLEDWQCLARVTGSHQLNLDTGACPPRRYFRIVAVGAER